MSCKIIRKFVYFMDKDRYHLDITPTLTIYKGMKSWGLIINNGDLFMIDIFSIDKDTYTIKNCYNNLKVEINDILSLSDEELVLIYGRSVLDKEIIHNLNLAPNINVSLSDFSKFLEM